jgi:nicotinate-nucleotide pyrophosphorylase (carboxylating)
MESATMEDFIRGALDEDTGAGDYSTLACIDPAARGRARLLVKESCVIAGTGLARRIFQYRDPGCNFNQIISDGQTTAPGDVVFEVASSAHTILGVERVVLNCMQRMSGIATLTRRFVEKLSGYHTRLLDTRKTTPNFRWAEKEAVRIGGGMNHRMGLYDMIMLKDNHIDYCGGIRQALEKTAAYLTQHQLSLKIEVEARTKNEVVQIVDTGIANRILLDNFTPEALKEALALIPKGTETEASGEITLENLETYAATGVDFVSVGAVIHHAASVDLSLKAIL